MSQHRASIRWTNLATPEEFLRGRYSREHSWAFDGGITIPASPAPSSVPPPWSNPAAIDPEEAFVASIASCHFLTFVHLARLGGFVVASYEDDPVGQMEKNAQGIPWVARVFLSPRIAWEPGREPAPDVERHLHHQAHEQCFIAASVRTEIVVSSP